MAGEQSNPACRSLACIALAALLLIALADQADGQRVQIPANSADTFGASTAPTLPPATPPFDPYASGAPPATAPYSSAPATLGTPTVAPIQPYAAQPYTGQPNAAQPFATPSYGAQPYTAQPFAPPPASQAFATPTAPGTFITPAPGAESTPLFATSPAVAWPAVSQWQSVDSTYQTFTRFLAELSIDHGYLYGDTNDANDLEVNELELRSTFTFPLGANPETPLLITPGFAFNFFDGPISDPTAMPRGPDIPPVLYDAYLDASWFPQPFPAFGADLGVRVGVYSDFDHIDSDSVRLLGRGLGVLSLTPSLDIVAGVVFLDRIDISLLPAGGVHYRPNEVWDFYAVFPTPRATRRLQTASTLDLKWFFAGEYGGGSWSANRAGFDDRFDYNDLRITTGFEWETPSRRRGSFEVGYVFDRELVFASTTPGPTSIDDTFILRLGVDL